MVVYMAAKGAFVFSFFGTNKDVLGCLFFLKILSGQAILYSVYQLNSHLQFAPVSFFKDLQEGPQRAWIWRVREVASLSACCPHT
jgi:hypothetical protein